ncbi:MAG: hypothetical protein A2826_00695 [Candidatus Doudnabacteria bacterium RIFCSPHIGHO2_01_FULL_43_23]|uniref:Uncharacterized protein n=1 Tax=Candidatus Doudnabacteria bacterium RIFCSPHIGHO2_01_FULL_43_23 TaxID=1817822 RepID=A0A1F5NTS4_9BACT|nr:MAG: hypothetical protein A2826_00695 [Candidatus Doudnabacteria bacterium RIFCSPHIGHO2_01_FULL_43_23]
MTDHNSLGNSEKLNNTDQLARAASKGDESAFMALYQDFFPKISRFVGVRVSHKQTTEDLTAEIFVKAWQYLQSEERIASFSSWIFTVARNRVIDYYRTKKSFSDIFELENLLEYEDNIVEAIDLGIASKEFLQVLGSLTDDQQQVIRLKFLEGLDNEEISAIIDKSSGSIRVIQHRAITSLKKLLSKK